MNRVCSCKNCSYECCNVVMVNGLPGPIGPPGEPGPPGPPGPDDVRVILVKEGDDMEVTAPEGFDLVEITAVGGGGAGDRVGDPVPGGGGGGGSGDRVSVVIDIDPMAPSTFTVQLGSGGVPSNNPIQTNGDNTRVLYDGINIIQSTGGLGAVSSTGGAAGGPNGFPGQNGTSVDSGGEGGDGGGPYGGAGGVPSLDEDEGKGKPGSMGSGGGGGAWIEGEPDNIYYDGGSGGTGYVVFVFYNSP